MAVGLDFAGMVPGFDFLQNLMKGAGAALPPMGQWVAPTLDPAELEKRISELRTVQFWLEQNAKLLATTIQAMEVQRMTLATLQSMNLPMADLRDALSIKPAAVPAFMAAAARAPEPDPEPPSPPAASAASAAMADDKVGTSSAAGAAPPAIDPMKWWGALTQQFTEIANQALQANAAASAAGEPAARAATVSAKPAAKAKARGVSTPAAPPRSRLRKTPASPSRKRSA